VALVILMVAVVHVCIDSEDRSSRSRTHAILKTHPGQRCQRTLAQGAVGDDCRCLWQELKPLANPFAPTRHGDKGVGDLDAVPMLKLCGCGRR